MKTPGASGGTPRQRGDRGLFVLGALLSLVLLSGPAAGAGREEGACPATRADSLGPFYVPGAPLRAKVGQGYVLAGTVRSAAGCEPIGGARVELWLAGRDGRYDQDHRATVVAAADGGYRFESNRPEPYAGRPPHIHLRVTAPGFRTLVTQHYPRAGESAGALDLVLVPEP